MRVSENLLPGKENALSAEYLVVKCHFSSVRMLQKAIEAERRDGKVILSSTTPPGGYYLPTEGDATEVRRFIQTLENRGGEHIENSGERAKIVARAGRMIVWQVRSLKTVIHQ